MRKKVDIFSRKEFHDEFDMRDSINESFGNKVLNSEIKSDEASNMRNGEMRFDSVNTRGIIKINDTLYKVNLEVL